MPGDFTKMLYKELFTLKLLHNGYGSPRPNTISDNIELHPDVETRSLFNNYNMGYRFFNDTLICFLRCDNTTLPEAPFIKFSEDVRIRFFMNATNDFISRTDVKATGATQVYQFTNQVNIGTGGFICMHTAGVNDDDLKNVDVVQPGKTCFGVVDVHNNGAVNSSYDLFSGVDQNLKSPAYSIRFISKI